ncbi:hypothetical protein E2C01_023537 [Portunus trituberculatus]|uniref:Uncharacterized protein n=1 Tax=Portunus trituberculatus TaxID=210409 RepID=A0A5B7EAT4_PORTR|nr:hypothetical protein [Portunus trituberculatus]
MNPQAQTPADVSVFLLDVKYHPALRVGKAALAGLQLLLPPPRLSRHPSPAHPFMHGLLKANDTLIQLQQIQTPSPPALPPALARCYSFSQFF